MSLRPLLRGRGTGVVHTYSKNPARGYKQTLAAHLTRKVVKLLGSLFQPLAGDAGRGVQVHNGRILHVQRAEILARVARQLRLLLRGGRRGGRRRAGCGGQGELCAQARLLKATPVTGATCICKGGECMCHTNQGPACRWVAACNTVQGCINAGSALSHMQIRSALEARLEGCTGWRGAGGFCAQEGDAAPGVGLHAVVQAAALQLHVCCRSARWGRRQR